MLPFYQSNLEKSIAGGIQFERIGLQELRRVAAVPERKSGGEGAGRITVQWLRVDAQSQLSNTAHWKPNGHSQG
jgi:hypothetical protein